MVKLRIVFMGTPNFAATVLKETAAWSEGKIIAVYTQPDRPSGRGKKLKESAVKILAKELGIPVFQPESFKDEVSFQKLADLNPDVIVVAAYGLILPRRVLDIPALGAYNVHASLLPKYRGAAPIQRAIMNGDTLSGITIMRMEAGLDSGPVLVQQALSIEPKDTAGTLFDKFALKGGQLMQNALKIIKEGRVSCSAQNDALATYAQKISDEEEYIDWSGESVRIHNIIRGLTPEPGAKSKLYLEGREPVILRLEPGEPVLLDSSQKPGTLLGMEKGALLVACGSGAYRITRLRPSGKSTMSAVDFYNGRLHGLTTPFGIFRKN